MKEVFILSTGDIVRGKMAGTQRVLKIAKSLAAGNTKTYLCSLEYIKNEKVTLVELFPGIFSLESGGNFVNDPVNISVFLRTVNNFLRDRTSDKIIYLYPTSFILKDFTYLLYFKLIKGYKLFCDINELRSTNVSSTTPPAKLFSRLIFLLRSARDLFSYKLNELQIPFYNGIVVISTNLERYFSGKAKKIVRIPILSDVSEAVTDIPRIQYDSIVFKICFTGIINCKKEGFDILFEALSTVNKTRSTELYLYGPVHDNDRALLKKLTEINNLEGKVYLMGNIGPDLLLAEFRKYHLLILPRPLNKQSKYGFSTKLSEYLISGIPVLVTDVSDNSLYLKDSFNGYIVPPGSPKYLAAKILEIISSYKDKSREIARNALETAKHEFDYHLFTHTFDKFFFSE